MEAQSLKVPGASVRFALGLNWRHESERPKGQRLKELAADRGRWGMVRKTAAGSFQVGFVAPIAGVDKAGMLASLADAVAEAHTAPWRGVFQLADGRYWYVAVGEGYAILPDGDRVCTADELATLEAAHASHGTWREVKGGIEELSELVVGFKAKAFLKDFAPRIGGAIPRRAKLVLSLVCAMSAIVGGIAFFIHHQDLARKEAVAAEKKRQALAALRAAPVVAVEKPEPRPWAEVPGVRLTVAACRDEWSAQALEKHGWVLQAWSCTAGAAGVEIATKWHREGGFAHDAPGMLDPSGELAFDTRSDAFEWNLSDSTKAEQLPGSIETSRASWTLAQRYGLALQLEAAPQAAPAVPGSSGDKPRPKWLARRETWSLPFAPWLGFAAGFEGLEGLRISSVQVDLTSDVWTVVSDVYVKA